MQWFQLAMTLVAMAEAVYKSIMEALAAGKNPTAVHAAIVDHVSSLPAKIAAV